MALTPFTIFNPYSLYRNGSVYLNFLQHLFLMLSTLSIAKTCLFYKKEILTKYKNQRLGNSS